MHHFVVFLYVIYSNYVMMHNQNKQKHTRLERKRAIMCMFASITPSNLFSLDEHAAQCYEKNVTVVHDVENFNSNT